MKIIVCEDDEILNQMLTMVFEKEGYTVIAVTDGVNLVQVVKDESAEAVILDLMLPEKDGYAILQELKDDPETAPVPVMVVSAFEKSEYIEGAKMLGAKDYVVKPFNTEDICVRLRNILA